MELLIQKRNGKLYIAEGFDSNGMPVIKTRSYADISNTASDENILGFLNLLTSLTLEDVVEKGLDTKAVFNDEGVDDDEEDFE